MKHPKLFAALGTAAAAASLAATATPAQAAATSATIGDTIGGKTATLNLDDSGNNETVSVANGVLVHTSVGGGLNSTKDWDSTAAGDQTVPADGTFIVAVNGGVGNDAITVLAKTTEISSANLHGGGGDDVLTGADTNDFLDGAEGNDRLVGAHGTDLMDGGDGNDTLVWNNGDGSDRMNGEAGNDGVELNGSPTAADTITLDPEPGGVKVRRTNLIQFTLETATERIQINGLGGGDSVAPSDGVGAATLLSVDGGAGDDTVNGSDGPDAIAGGEGNDTLSGGGGDDRIAGDRGSDTMNGGTGDDTLVWNNGDGSDIMNGDDGRDDVEVNGSPGAGDTSTVQPNGARIRFTRTNLVPFALDIGSSETMHANGLGGDDSQTVGSVGGFSVTADGGSGNDTLTGGSGPDTLIGGSGNDTITGGGGIDVVNAGSGDDHVALRDRTADVAFGGEGRDSVVADRKQLDVLDGFEQVDRTPDPVVHPGPPGRVVHAATVAGGTVKVSKRTRIASIRLSCPAGSAGACIGSVEIRTAKSVKLAGLRVSLGLGSARYDVAPGGSVTARVKLARGVARLAGRNGRLPVVAVSSTGSANDIASSSRRLTLALGATQRRAR